MAGSLLLLTPGKNNDSYRKAQKFVRLVKVTNDVAERGVKLMNDFATQITTDPRREAAYYKLWSATGINLTVSRKPH